MNDINDIFSYKSIRNSIHLFKSGVGSGEPEFMYDEPGYFFWKPIFYFYNGDSFSDGIGNGGLLYPSWINFKDETYVNVEDNSNSNGGKALNKNKKAINDALLENSAYNYLMRNGELKRAKLLQNFITLLSDISSNSPWYFKEVSGLDEAVSKKAFFQSPTIDETRKQITITCLADSIDARIGTMLDMYRSACFSWQSKREIVPRNLRKFDMGIYVFTKPYNAYKKVTDSNKLLYNVLNEDDNRSIETQSCKYLEFHNCEIDLDSCKFGDTFTVESATHMEYKIVISYDNCYDNRYSDQFVGVIGDSIVSDLIEMDNLTTDTNGLNIGDSKTYGDYELTNLTGVENSITPIKTTNKLYDSNKLFDSDLNGLFKDIKSELSNKSFVNNVSNNLIDSTIGVAKQAVKSAVGGFLLGNLYTGSIRNIVSDISQGRLIKGAIDTAKVITSPETIEYPLGNLFGTIDAETRKNALIANKSFTNGQSLGTFYENKPTQKTVNNLGSLNNAKTAIKNL